jgi:glucose-1-phosphate adenylyltransferase
VNEGAVIEDSIVMDFTSVGKGAHLRRAIVDRYNIIPAGHQLGLDSAVHQERYRVDASGLVVVPRGGRREFLWTTESP